MYRFRLVVGVAGIPLDEFDDVDGGEVVRESLRVQRLPVDAALAVGRAGVAAANPVVGVVSIVEEYATDRLYGRAVEPLYLAEKRAPGGFGEIRAC